MLKIFVSLSLVFSLAFSSELFLLPKDAKKAQNEIINLIDNSKKEISIAMYNFSYKKFAKPLIKAYKKGVKISIIFDAKKIKDEDSSYKLLKKSGIDCIIADKKMHLKVAIFDKQKMLLGSSNWSKKSFKKNYEILFLDENKSRINQVNDFLIELSN